MANVPVQVFNGRLDTSAGTTTLGSAVPAGSKYVLREITLGNGNTTAERVRIRLGTNSDDTDNILDVTLPPAGTAGSTETFPYALTMVATDQLKGFADTINKVRCVISAQQII